MLTITDEAEDVYLDSADFPVLNSVAMRAVEMIDSGRATALDLEMLLQSDAGLAMRVLRLANSPVFAARSKINSIAQAVVRPGMSEVKSTILAAATGNVFDKTQPYIGILWQHSIATAAASRWVAERLGVAGPEECYLAGMLHDIGKVMIYRQEKELYTNLIDISRERKIRFFELERERINYCTHETVAVIVARKWHLSRELIQAFRFHHDIEVDMEICRRVGPIVPIVSLANLHANALGYGLEDPESIDLAASNPCALFELNEDYFAEADRCLPEIIEDQLSAVG